MMKINRITTYRGIFLILLITLAFSGCERIKEAYSKKKAAGPGAAAQAMVFAVNTTTAVQGQIQDYIPLSGEIVAGSTVDTYSDAAGKITQVFVTVGDRVSKGDPIAAVDPSRPGMTYRIGIAAAPISGTVVALPAQVGMTISQAVPLARISGGGALELKLYVAERFISKMAMNLSCEITLDAWPGDIFQGSISEIAPTVDSASRTMEVRVNVRNAGSKLKPGMFAKVKIITERKDSIVKIPAQAVISRFGEQYVFVVEKRVVETGDEKNAAENNVAGNSDENGNAEEKIETIVRKRVIVPGILIDGVMEIQQGLTAGEEIVVRGQTLLDDGARINVVERVSPLKTN
jgi:multidrug efflux pump subunit AcrA (membrane-fusion protein)